MLRTTLAGLALTLIAGTVSAHGFKLGALEIGHPYAIETAPGAPTAAGYLTITNTGSDPDRLIAVEADFPRVQIHETEIDASGVARMRHIEALELPPGATVSLQPRGTHVMFMGLTEPLEEGAKIDATLVFEGAGAVAVQFNVEPRAAGADAETDPETESMDHTGH